MIIAGIFILLGASVVLPTNPELHALEASVLHQHLRTPNELNSFSRKLLHSNDVDNSNFLHATVAESDAPDRKVKHKCFKSTKDVLSASDSHPKTINDSFTRADIERLLPTLTHAKLNDGCRKSQGYANWRNIVVGVLTVTFINCSALGGAIILPFRKKPAFKWILNAFLGLAVGTLTGSGVFHLIPMAFNIPSFVDNHSYMNKALVTMIAIYLVYIRDQLSRVFFDLEIVVYTHSDADDPIFNEKDRLVDSFSSTSQKSFSKSSKLIVQNQYISGLLANLRAMEAAGWMVFLGDMLHNFIDGLTLGAAFMVSIGEGLRLSLPIICEEFPHELGDMALLLRSGLSIGQALVVNFLAACSCYLGFFIGAKLGELEEAHPWIYALAGGMFVYIGLADMIPELVAMADEIEKDYLKAKQPVSTVLRLKILLCQNSGVILGVLIMFALSKYGAHLEHLVHL